MPGQPQLRESAVLHVVGNEYAILAMVRLEQLMDGSGRWVILLNDPAWEQESQRVEFDDEKPARAALAQVYADGEAQGVWKVNRPEPY
ncbi:hypothetical protein [Micromonospora chersina]|uniref:hypothetical protein n=1 Tax=Micromonospora chersina TaxID=47854 RepID=UPI0037113AF5